MARFVMDAGVAVKWFLPEDRREAARRLLGDGSKLSSPDLVRAEFGNVMWKRRRRDEMSSEEAGEVLRDFKRFPLEIRAAGPLLGAVWAISENFDRSFYVALAASTDCRLVTADRKLYNALQESDLAEHMVWIEEVCRPESEED